MSEPFPLGKLPADLLSQLLSQVSRADPRIVVGPGVGLDAAVLDMGDRYLVAKTDPITFATDQVGWYAVNVNANDVVCMGGIPRWFMATLLMPEGQSGEQLAISVFDQIKRACGALNLSLVGGHTEITYGIDRPIVMGCMLGEVEPDRLVTPAGIKVGDAVILAGGVPIEATAIIAREKAHELKGKFEDEFLSKCAGFLENPGISVVAAAQLAQKAGEVHGMHDPTEGGLAMGLWELAQASQTNIRIHESDIHVVPEGRILCEHYGLDPLATIASGALLLAVSPTTADRVTVALNEAGHPASIIGEVSGRGDGEVTLISEEGEATLTPPPRDDITKLFEGS